MRGAWQKSGSTIPEQGGRIGRGGRAKSSSGSLTQRGRLEKWAARQAAGRYAFGGSWDRIF